MAAASKRVAWAGSTRASRLPPGWRSRIRPAVLARDGYTCQLRYDVCTGAATEVDHKKRGDDHSMPNLQAVCSACHQVKTLAELPPIPTLRRPPERHPGLL
jgi:5-methylcytosine-specific restriction endonuclease McrA